MARDSHPTLNAIEMARILAHGGTFLTQQVHGLWAEDLIACFGNRLYYVLQEALKDALDNANNNKTFVQPTPCPFRFVEP